MHLLVNELQVNNLPVRNDLIEELDHHVLRGLSSKDQLEHIVIKQICILKSAKKSA